MALGAWAFWCQSPRWGGTASERDTVCNLGVLLELWILLEEQMVVVAKRSFAHLQVAPIPELGGSAHYHSSSYPKGGFSGANWTFSYMRSKMSSQKEQESAVAS